MEHGGIIRREHGAYYTSEGDQVAQSILLDVPLRPTLPESNFVKCRIVGLPCGQFWGSAPFPRRNVDVPKADQSSPYSVAMLPSDSSSTSFQS